MKPKLLWVSDACCPTGFATVTHSVLGWLGSKWERCVLGLNATGDPHSYPYPVYPARVGGDFWGFGRFGNLVRKETPDVIVIQSDAWIVEGFLDIATRMGDCPPVVGFMPIDGMGMKRSTAANLSSLALAAFYTEFGVKQAVAAGLTANATAIGLGVRHDIFQPMPKAVAMQRLFPDLPRSAFVFGNVNRNQPRKRLDLTIAWFAEWIKREPAASENSYLYLHCLTDDVGWDLGELKAWYGVDDRVFLTTARSPEELLSESAMRIVYNALDVQVTTTMGEGWGLPTLEGMACGVPQIVPDWAALGEWPRGAVRYVPVEPGAANFGQKAFGIGATPDKETFIRAMSELRHSASERRALSDAGIQRANEPRFEWSHVAQRFDEELTKIIQGRAQAAA